MVCKHPIHPAAKRFMTIPQASEFGWLIYAPHSSRSRIAGAKCSKCPHGSAPPPTPGWAQKSLKLRPTNPHQSRASAEILSSSGRIMQLATIWLAVVKKVVDTMQTKPDGAWASPHRKVRPAKVHHSGRETSSPLCRTTGPDALRHSSRHAPPLRDTRPTRRVPQGRESIRPYPSRIPQPLSLPARWLPRRTRIPPSTPMRHSAARSRQTPGSRP